MSTNPGPPASYSLPIPFGTQDAADSRMSAAFAKALGAATPKPHPAEVHGPTGARAAEKNHSSGLHGFARSVAVKPIAPRSGHR